MRSSPLCMVLLAALLAATGACAGGGAPADATEASLVLPPGDSLIYRLVGHGPDTILVVPGGVGSSRYLEAAFGALGGRHTLVFYDMRGRGRSSPVAPESLSIAGDVADLEALRRHLGLGALRLLAHQRGAGVAFEYARTHPERVRRMVFLAPMIPHSSYTFQLTRLYQGVVDTASAAARTAGLDRTDPAGFCQRFWFWQFGTWKPEGAEVVRSLAPAVCDAPPAQLAQRALLLRQLPLRPPIWDWESQLDSVAAPRLVILGEAEAPFVELGRRWTYKGPGRLLVVGRSPHFPWVDAPRAVRAAIEDFLVREQWPPAARQEPPFGPAATAS